MGTVVGAGPTVHGSAAHAAAPRPNPAHRRPGGCLPAGRLRPRLAQCRRRRSASPACTGQLSADDQRAFGVVWETLTELERDYYRRDQLDAEKLAAAAAKGMVAAVGDPYTTLTSAQQSELTAAQLRGSFEGVGLELDRGDGSAAGRLTSGGLAGRAGWDPLRRRDRHRGWRRRGAARRGPGRNRQPHPRAARHLGHARPGARRQPARVVVVRDTIKVESVRSRLLPGDTPLAYVRINDLFGTHEPAAARTVGAAAGPGLKGGGARPARQSGRVPHVGGRRDQ